MGAKQRIQLAAAGALVGVLAAWCFLRPGPTPPASPAPPTTASASAPLPATTRAVTLPPPAAAVTSATTPAPPPVTAVKFGDAVVDATRGTLRRDLFAHGVYDRLDDGDSLWLFKEGSGKALRLPRPPTVARGQAAVRAAMTQPGAAPVDPATVKWPDVAALKIADPATLLDDAVPPENGPYSHEIVTAGLKLSVNRFKQAEDGTFFLVCGERWIGKARAPELPPLRITAGIGYTVGPIARISAPGVRLAIVLVKAPKQDAAIGRVDITLIAGNDSVEADLKAVDIERTFSSISSELWAIVTAADGMADVRVSGWALGASGKMVEQDQRPAAWTAEDFARALLTQTALQDAR